MEELLSALKEWNCDIDGAMARFLDDRELYRQCLCAVVEDGNFAGLGESLKAGNVKEAFEHAHTLKGVIANMGLTPLYDIVVQIVEPLRAGTCENLLPLYEQLIEENNKLRKFLA